MILTRRADGWQVPREAPAQGGAREPASPRRPTASPTDGPPRSHRPDDLPTPGPPARRARPRPRNRGPGARPAGAAADGLRRATPSSCATCDDPALDAEGPATRVDELVGLAPGSRDPFVVKPVGEPVALTARGEVAGSSARTPRSPSPGCGSRRDPTGRPSPRTHGGSSRPPSRNRPSEARSSTTSSDWAGCPTRPTVSSADAEKQRRERRDRRGRSMASRRQRRARPHRRRRRLGRRRRRLGRRRRRLGRRRRRLGRRRRRLGRRRPSPSTARPGIGGAPLSSGRPPTRDGASARRRGRPSWPCSTPAWAGTRGSPTRRRTRDAEDVHRPGRLSRRAPTGDVRRPADRRVAGAVARPREHRGRLRRRQRAHRRAVRSRHLHRRHHPAALPRGGHPVGAGHGFGRSRPRGRRRRRAEPAARATPCREGGPGHHPARRARRRQHLTRLLPRDPRGGRRHRPARPPPGLRRRGGRRRRVRRKRRDAGAVLPRGLRRAGARGPGRGGRDQPRRPQRRPVLQRR